MVRAIGSSPDEPYSLIYATLLSAIGSAETSVHITNAYFAPDPQLLAALEAAAARGVDVKLILPSQTDSWLVFHAGRGYYAQLLRAGVKIYERRGAILHSKTALVDGVWATVGSTNLDWRSFLHNHELNAVVLGAEFGKQVQAMFEQDLAASDAITLEQWERRPLQMRVKELAGAGLGVLVVGAGGRPAVADAARSASSQSLAEWQQDVGVPGAVQPERLVQLRSRVPTSSRAEWTPSSIHGRSPGIGSALGSAHDDRRATGAPVRARIGQEVALALETQAERRRDHRVAHDRHVVQRVVKAERKAHHQQRRADLDAGRAADAGAWA